MNKKFFILLLFWWSMIFPSLSLNTFTTDIIDDNISYAELNNCATRKEILENAEYSLSFFLFSSK